MQVMFHYNYNIILFIDLLSVSQVTTHSHLPSSSDYENLSEELDGMNILCLFLQEFDTELDFTNKIRLEYYDSSVVQ